MTSLYVLLYLSLVLGFLVRKLPPYVLPPVLLCPLCYPKVARSFTHEKRGPLQVCDFRCDGGDLSHKSWVIVEGCWRSGVPGCSLKVRDIERVVADELTLLIEKEGEVVKYRAVGGGHCCKRLFECR